MTDTARKEKIEITRKLAALKDTPSYQETVRYLADEIHNNWKEEYKKQNGSDATRWKPVKTKEDEDFLINLANKTRYPTGGDAWFQTAVRTNPEGKMQVNILALNNSYLPPCHSQENTASAIGAIDAVLSNPGKDVEFYSNIIHEQWMDRNKSWAPAEQMKPYSKLSEEEKEKDRIVARLAQKTIQNEIDYRGGKLKM